MNVYHGERPSLVCKDQINFSPKLTAPKWNKYRWVDFDQQSLRYLHSSPTGVVTMEMEPMTLTSRIKVYRIHYYNDREDLFSRHLEYAKSLCA
jgi:hypothetical protein